MRHFNGKRMLIVQSLCLRGILVAGLGLAGCRSGEDSQRQRMLMQRPAPEFELTALDGSTVSLSSFRGKPVLLAFWAYG